MVECVMMRAVARLESTSFDASDVALTYNKARHALIREAIAVLSSLQGFVARSEPARIWDPPDFQRLAFLLKRVAKVGSHPSFQKKTSLR